MWQPRRAVDTSTNWWQSLFCCCTASMEQATDGAETVAIDGLVLSWSENISVSFCLQAPGYGLTLWCALGLLVEGAIQVPHLQLQYNSSFYRWVFSGILLLPSHNVLCTLCSMNWSLTFQYRNTSSVRCGVSSELCSWTTPAASCGLSTALVLTSFTHTPRGCSNRFVFIIFHCFCFLWLVSPNEMRSSVD